MWNIKVIRTISILVNMLFDYFRPLNAYFFHMRECVTYEN